MNAAQIWWEYRQIVAYEYEKKTGKSYKDDETLSDPEYDKYLKSIGFTPSED